MLGDDFDVTGLVPSVGSLVFQSQVRELEVTAGWTFVRFHHGTRGRNGNYSETEIAEWAERIDGWREGGIDVYAYFNNDWEGYAVRNGLRLRELLGV